jgi:hypothetical protein
MASSDPALLPDVAEILAPLLARVPREHQPLFLAIAERMAAERYRRWATERPENAQDLHACAEREEEIAKRVEALSPDAAAIQRDMLGENPDLEVINRTLFAGRPLTQQFTIQARGERLGAATWRAFAMEPNRSSAQTLLACAELEEANARVLEGILEAET